VTFGSSYIVFIVFTSRAVSLPVINKAALLFSVVFMCPVNYKQHRPLGNMYDYFSSCWFACTLLMAYYEARLKYLLYRSMNINVYLFLCHLFTSNVQYDIM